MIAKFILKRRFSIVFLILAISAVFATEIATLLYWRRQIELAEFKNDFPRIVLAERTVLNYPNSYKKNYDFGNDYFTRNLPVWRKLFAPLKGEGLNYLEVGAYEGRSVIWMLENVLTDPNCRVTAIDLFDGPFKDKYYANIKLSGFADKVTTIENYSQLALRELPLDSFDIIYIDGSHAKADVLEDAVLSWRLLKKGGLLIFDDYQYIGTFDHWDMGNAYDFPKAGIDAFAQCFVDKFEVVHNDYQFIVRRKEK